MNGLVRKVLSVKCQVLREKGCSIRIIKEHHIAQARRTARSEAEALGFSSRDVSYIETGVSELASNLFFHTGYGGVLFFIPVSDNDRQGIEIISEDEGPGISDIKLAMTDGYSTRGGLGGGLPGVKRLMDEFEIFSEIGKGTRIITRKWKKSAHTSSLKQNGKFLQKRK